MGITFICNRTTNELEDTIFEIGANFFANNNDIEEVYIFYGEYGKTFFIGKDKGIIADVKINLGGFEYEGDMQPIYLFDDERYVTDYVLNTFDKYEKGYIEDNATITTEQMLNSIMKNLEILLLSKVINGEFEPTLKEFFTNVANKYCKQF